MNAARFPIKQKKTELRNLPFNLGLIGFGSCGKIQYDALKTVRSQFSLQMVSDIEKKSMKDTVRFTNNYTEILKNPAIEAVSIATPPSTHFEIAIDALSAGKHVLVEKPHALTVDQCNQMIAMAKQKEKVLFMSFHARYHPVVEAARKELTGKDVTGIRIQYSEYAPNYHASDGWIFNPEISGGGVLMDSGINALSIVTYVLPNLPGFTVSDAQFKNVEHFKVETKAQVEFTFGQAGRGSISMDWMNTGPEVRQVIFTADGHEYTVDIVKNIFSKDGIMPMSVDPYRKTVDQVSEYKGVYQHFAELLANGVSQTHIHELAFILAAYRKAGLYTS
ncbi:MAG: Gfo/Idh/MocA family protein [Candidatus Levyibacteriota bacterium]